MDYSLVVTTADKKVADEPKGEEQASKDHQEPRLEKDEAEARDTACMASEEDAGDDDGSSGAQVEKKDSPLVRSDGRIRWRYLAWAVGSLLALAVFIWLLMAVQTVSVPFLIAFILAYILDPLVDRMEAFRISRTLCICILLLGLLLVGAAVLFLIGPQLMRELGEIPDKLHQLMREVVPWIEGRFNLSLPRTMGAALEYLQGRLGGFEMTSMTAPTLDLLRAVLGGTASILSVIVAILLVPLFSFFLLRDFDRIVDGVRELLPKRYRGAIVERFREIDQAMSGFVRGQLTVAGILAVLYTAGLWAVGLPMALLVGIISGIGNMVPYVGTAIGLVLATFVVVLDFQGLHQLLLVYAVFVVVQAVESWLLTPRIVGDSVGLSPLLVIIAVLVFGELFGFVGILIAVPLAAIVKILLRVLLEEYRASPFFRG